MDELFKTVLHESHIALGATMVASAAGTCKLQHRTDIVEKHWPRARRPGF